MKPRWVIAAVLVALVTAGAAALFLSRDSAQKALEETRQSLRQQGFKIDLKEFDLRASAEQSARATALTNADPARIASSSEDYARQAVLRQDSPNLMAPVGPDAAVVVWKQEKLASLVGTDPWLAQARSGEDLWELLREVLGENRERLDAACAAALGGPIRFDLAASHGSAMLLPHLAVLRRLMQILGTRAVVELHNGNQDAAWTNVLAAARLVTAWEPEPTEISHMVRFACTTLAYNAAWQALQASGWTDDRLARLQQEWEAVDFFKGLPETAAFTRASTAATCQLERQQPLTSSVIRGLMHYSRFALLNVWYQFIERWRQVRYRHHGSYEDERALLLHYRDREVELRRAVQATNWVEMRPLPGVTNLVPFQSRYRSRTQMLLNLRQTSLTFAGRGQRLLSRAAEAEARRRVLIAAIALERYHGRHGSYPKALQDLVPGQLQQPPVDFMDGRPLRYHLTGDGHFVLYSIGLDGVDNGGEMRRPRQRGQAYPGDFEGGGPYPGGPEFGMAQGTDLVWPRPADDHGQRFTGDAFDSVFDVKLPGSGRSQTLKGP